MDLRSVTHTSPAEAKLALFRGRVDVYPRRFESRKTGRSGYAPACANEWVRGICEKPRIRCADCAHRRFLPVTDDVVRWHLSGHGPDGQPFVAGVYPLLLDETCCLLAIDFDKANWYQDASAFLETCGQLQVPAALERSRSGRGGHVWIFFEDAVPATLARRLGSHLLTETMVGRPDIGFDSYDRLFPSQDTLPHGGFGNLVALPLQRGPREKGNSVFLNEDGEPWSDQWAFLAHLDKMPRARVERIVLDAERRGLILGVKLPPQEDGEHEPWTAPPSGLRRPARIDGELPQSLELVLGNQIYVSKAVVPPALRNQLLRLAAFQNPEFYKAQAMRLSTYGKPRVIACAEEFPEHIGLPRGCFEEACELLTSPPNSHGYSRRAPQRAPTRGDVPGRAANGAAESSRRDVGPRHGRVGRHHCVRQDGDRRMAHRPSRHEHACLGPSPAVARPVDRAALDVPRPASEIHRAYRRRRSRPTGLLDVALIQSLVRKGVVDDRVAVYGHVIVDECHHLSAQSFERVARQAKARFVTGLSATIARKDGHHPIIVMGCGPVRYRVNAKSQAASRPFEQVVLVQPTSFQPARSAESDKRVEFQTFCQELIENDVRSRRICDDVIGVVRGGRSPLVLTERNAHLDRLEAALASTVRHLVVLRAGLGKKQRQALADRLAAIPADEERIVLATGKYVGEGFDDARLDTLFLTLPVSWRGTIAQYAGRLHRLHDGKREVRIYDYADLNVPMLSRMFDRRCRGYEAIGYRILLSASAVPGWPADVPLPSDPLWKRDYAGSVQRLVRDGVDTPLAGLFVHVARTVPPDAHGADRARSASEAFLYRRLQTLPVTKDRFRLNASLPIAFDGTGALEVDFLCDDARLAVELDGAQHLSDPAAYRRDRRKDQLLQEHGYLVLRFLAEDIGKELSLVLDRILRVVNQREAVSTAVDMITVPAALRTSGARASR